MAEFEVWGNTNSIGEHSTRRAAIKQGKQAKDLYYRVAVTRYQKGAGYSTIISWRNGKKE